MTDEQMLKLNKRDIAVGIKSILTDINMSQNNLAMFSSTGTDKVSRTVSLNSDTVPSVRTLSRMLNAFNMSFVDFFNYVKDNTVEM